MFLKSMHCKLLLGFLLLYLATIIILQFTWFELLLFTMLISVIGFPVTLILAGRKFAPRPFNNFATWFAVVCLGIVVFHVIGQDDKWLLITLLGFDRPYDKVLELPGMVQDEMITTLGLFMRVVLGAIYGLLVDVAFYVFRKMNNRWERV